MLRAYVKTDIPQLLSIERATQVAPWGAEIFTHCFTLGYEGWVIEQEKQIVGFLVMSTVATGESHILNLCIDPRYQRQGLGYQLLDYAIKYAKSQGTGIIYLEVRRSNRSAIALYHKMDFVQISERKNYYPALKGREDALVFARDLGVD